MSEFKYNLHVHNIVCYTVFARVHSTWSPLVLLSHFTVPQLSATRNETQDAHLWL